MKICSRDENSRSAKKAGGEQTKNYAFWRSFLIPSGVYPRFIYNKGYGKENSSAHYP
jgi:hypothetical protein